MAVHPESLGQGVDQGFVDGPRIESIVKPPSPQEDDRLLALGGDGRDVLQLPGGDVGILGRS